MLIQSRTRLSPGWMRASGKNFMNRKPSPCCSSFSDGCLQFGSEIGSGTRLDGVIYSYSD
ncbi:hypothetical protein P3T16_003029 [Paraburkholderia sp. GAS42]